LGRYEEGASVARAAAADARVTKAVRGLGRAGDAGPAALAAATALGAPAARVSAAAAGPVAAGVDTATPDSYESGAGDDTMATARALPDHVTYFADAPYTEQHTIDTARGATATAEWDEDWYRFTVTEAEIAGDGLSVLIEAWTDEAEVDPLIEVYRAGASATDPRSMPATKSGDTTYTDFDPNCTYGADECRWWWNHGASVAIQFDPDKAAALAGTYYVRVRPYYQGDFGDPDFTPGFWWNYEGAAGAYTLRFKMGLAQRIAGANRYATARYIANEVFPDGACDGGAILLATGKSFPDALSGSGLAGPASAPLVLTDGASLSPDAAAEIARLAQGPEDTVVCILGGTGAVSAAVATQVDALAGITVVRLAHPEYDDRYGTAAFISEFTDYLIGEMYPGYGITPVAFIVSGANYPDALAASPMATWNWAPVLLVKKDSVPAATDEALDMMGITDVVIVGGTGAVGTGVQTTLATKLGDADHVRRIAGATRYETARMFAEWAGSMDPADLVGTPANPSALFTLYSEEVGLASGRNFPDALAGGVMCGHAGTPLLLDDLSAEEPEVYNYVDNVYDDNCFDATLWKSYAFGGAGAVSDTDFLFYDFLTVPWWVTL
ncbi:MAG: cell wall-binding repeat-containing protein, partial [Actinobacteria bacterium]